MNAIRKFVGIIGAATLACLSSSCLETAEQRLDRRRSDPGAPISHLTAIPENAVERRTLDEATYEGGYVGAHAGAIIAGASDVEPVVGAVAGALVGGVLGNMAAKEQLNRRDLDEMENEDSFDLVRAARVYNHRVEQQMEVLTFQVDDLNPLTRNKKAVLRTLDYSCENVDATIRRGERLVKDARGPWASAYRAELAKLKLKRARLQALREGAVAKTAKS